MFNLEGTFQSFIGRHSSKPKSIVLEVETEPIVIKLPKELRAYAGATLKPGDRLRCIGSSHVDFKAGVIKLKAYQVFFLSELAAALPSQDAAAVGQPLTPTQMPPTRPKPNRSKILVCRKSGCQKRGGRKMVEAMERILEAYQLTDQVEIHYTGCNKRCSKAPTLTVMPGKYCYEKVNAADLTALIEEHFCPSDSNC
jgi:(2Fe-2S) ferredoxin